MKEKQKSSSLLLSAAGSTQAFARVNIFFGLISSGKGWQ
jgi:hypothetical protein